MGSDRSIPGSEQFDAWRPVPSLSRAGPGTERFKGATPGEPRFGFIWFATCCNRECRLVSPHLRAQGRTAGVEPEKGQTVHYFIKLSFIPQPCLWASKQGIRLGIMFRNHQRSRPHVSLGSAVAKGVCGSCAGLQVLWPQCGPPG